jgi:serine/threonine protein kinase
MFKYEPKIIQQKPLKKTGLFKVKVVYPEIDNPFIKLKTEYIAKYLPIQNVTSSIIKINPVFIEAFINKNFRSKYLNTAEIISIQMGNIVLFFNEASGNYFDVRIQPFNKIKEWIKSVVKGIIHLHSHRILHGDIKAENILIFENEAKLSDFGLSSLIVGDGIQNFVSKLYTPTHRAPEVWLNDKWDLSADIWSLGCTIFEMIYHRPLFQIKKTTEEYLEQIEAWSNLGNEFHSNVELTLEWNNPRNSEINNLILKMLNPIPSERPTIFEIIENPFFENEASSGSSPPCEYKFLNNCPIVAQRIYNFNNFKNKSLYDEVNKYIMNYEPNEEIRMLTLSIYETHEELHREINKKLIRIISILVSLLVNREKPRLFSLNRDDVITLIEFSNKVNFNYINWSKFYGVYAEYRY